MPLNKDALIRYRIINRCLLKGKTASKEKLIEACQEALDIYPLGERTIEKDLHDMRYDDRLGYYAPIRFNRSENGYFYEDPDYSIDQLPINEDELEALSFAATMLNQYKDIKIFSTFSGAVQKIVDALNIRRMMSAESPYPFVQFEHVPAFKGSEYLQSLVESIVEKKVIEIQYQRFNSSRAHIHTIHPYLLKEYRNRWYLIGFNQEIKEIRTYGLDRILSIRHNKDLEYHASDFDPEDYFRSTVGIIAPQTKPEKIVVRLSKVQGKYLLTQPIHESQETLEETDSYITFQINVIPTYELISMILGWGAEVEILKPIKLRKQIQSILKNALSNYDGII